MGLSVKENVQMLRGMLEENVIQQLTNTRPMWEGMMMTVHVHEGTEWNGHRRVLEER